MQDTERVLPSL